MKVSAAITFLAVGAMWVSTDTAEAQCYEPGVYYSPPAYYAPPVYYSAPMPQYPVSYGPYYSTWGPRYRYSYRSPGYRVTVRRGHWGNYVYREHSRYGWRY